MRKLMKCLLAGLLAAGFAGCGTKSVSDLAKEQSGIIYAKDGYAEGNLGDTLGTAWFSFKVNSAELTDSYGGSVTPAEGETLLVVNVTIENTYGDDLPMFDSDFQAQWGSEGDDDYRFPVTLDDESLQTGNMLAGEYTLSAGETTTGDLVFSVPQGFQDFSLSFMEYYDNEETGDTFFIFFPAN